MNDKPKYGQQVLVLLLLFVGLTIASSCLMVVMGLFGVDLKDPNVMIVMQGVSQLIAFMLPPVLLAVIYRHDMKGLFQLDFSAGKWGKGLIGVVVLILLFPIIDWSTQWNESWHFGSGFLGELEQMLRDLDEHLAETSYSLLQGGSAGKLILNLVVVALIPALCEELFFRGAIQQLLTRWMKNPHLAVLVTSVVFSLAHGEIFGFVPRLLMGMLLGYLFYYGGSLVVNVLVHFVNNSIVVVLFFLASNGFAGISPEEPLNVMWQWTALFTVAAVGLFYANFVMDHKGSKIGKND